MRDAEISKVIRNSLQENLSDLQSGLIQMCELYNECLQQYSELMDTALDQVDYFERDDLLKLHQDKKNETIEKVCHKYDAIQNNSNSYSSFILQTVSAKLSNRK